MQYQKFLRIEKLKKILGMIAYGSLAIDVAIAVVTLVSLNAYSQQLDKIQFFLNIALTVEVIVTLIIVIAMGLIYHYDKILDHLAKFSSLLTGEQKMKRRNR